MLPAKCYCFNVAKINAAISLERVKMRQREIEILSCVIYIHQPMLPAKCYCFNVAKINAAISLERVKMRLTL